MPRLQSVKVRGGRSQQVESDTGGNGVPQQNVPPPKKKQQYNPSPVTSKMEKLFQIRSRFCNSIYSSVRP